MPFQRWQGPIHPYPISNPRKEIKLTGTAMSRVTIDLPEVAPQDKGSNCHDSSYLRAIA